jgi:hypothetical protein
VYERYTVMSCIVCSLLYKVTRSALLGYRRSHSFLYSHHNNSWGRRDVSGMRLTIHMTPGWVHSIPSQSPCIAFGNNCSLFPVSKSSAVMWGSSWTESMQYHIMLENIVIYNGMSITDPPKSGEMRQSRSIYICHDYCLGDRHTVPVSY